MRGATSARYAHEDPQASSARSGVPLAATATPAAPAEPPVVVPTSPPAAAGPSEPPIPEVNPPELRPSLHTERAATTAEQAPPGRLEVAGVAASELGGERPPTAATAERGSAAVVGREVWPPAGWPTWGAAVLFPVVSALVCLWAPLQALRAHGTTSVAAVAGAAVLTWLTLALAGCAAILARDRSGRRGLLAAGALSFTHLLAMFVLWLLLCPDCRLGPEGVWRWLLLAMGVPLISVLLTRLGLRFDSRELWRGLGVGAVGAVAIVAIIVPTVPESSENAGFTAAAALGAGWVHWISRREQGSAWRLTPGGLVVQTVTISNLFIVDGVLDGWRDLMLAVFVAWSLWHVGRQSLVSNPNGLTRAR